jgi:LmbE family N-acetylglucosaminyl deacetylase/SAM-dependent methyltransferase
VIVATGAEDLWRDAAAYDHWFDSPWGAHAAGVETRAVMRAIDGGFDGRSVVDVGCGSGRLGAELRRAGARVIGIDTEPAMLDIARGRIDDVVIGDILALPLPDGSVDVALAVTVLEFVDDRATAMAELARVTRPGGRVIVGALNPHSPWGVAHHREFSTMPWRSARFLTRGQLRALGTPYGRVALDGALYAPGVLPCHSVVAPVLEAVGHAAPAWGAIQLLVVERTDSPAPTAGQTTLLPDARRVLAVCAHPDDETFGLGAILSAYVDRGATVDLVCLTRGDASTLGADDAALGHTRVMELTKAAHVLGIHDVITAEYADGHLDGVPLDELVATIRPHASAADLFIVFDEGGITGHPDHRRATAAALDLATALDVPVLSWTLRDDVAGTLNGEFGAGFVGRPPHAIDAMVWVDRTRQREAMRHHASQNTANPVPERRLALTGDVEALRWLRSPHASVSERDHRGADDG